MFVMLRELDGKLVLEDGTAFPFSLFWRPRGTKFGLRLEVSEPLLVDEVLDLLDLSFWCRRRSRHRDP